MNTSNPWVVACRDENNVRAIISIAALTIAGGDKKFNGEGQGSLFMQAEIMAIAGRILKNKIVADQKVKVGGQGA